ncbi:GntR family transcriptional regulator [Microbacterium betulae]|uniref:GntR family transcriptional regulator n=1 Tax=Microbacterium betulae TaxID=2981139 RepID=A0AA97FHK6_9MICO|nr:GntR family transcriptional regulator [Microbacterium sp. AB]WOF22699.1 GntR family transcriptional regulator [Microbacterium sp. AB]
MTPDGIADGIASAIRDGVYDEGDQLVQEDLAKQFGVSRNPVREALRLLEARGLITIRDGGGATVRRLSPDDLAEVYALRVAVEPTIARPVIEGATSRAIARLRALAERMAQTSDTAEWLRSNFEFHQLIYELSDRPRTVSILTSLLTAAQPYARKNVEALGGRAQADADHIRIIETIVDGDPDALGSALVSHMTQAEHRVESSYER